jgi:hypothetical protein
MVYKEDDRSLLGKHMEKHLDSLGAGKKPKLSIPNE